MKKILLFSVCLFALSITAAKAQTPKEQAKSLLKTAIKLEDEDEKYDEALILIKEAQKLDPENYTYPFELGYTYTKKKEYQKAVDCLEPLLKHKDVTDQTYQALGDNYDYLGQRAKALQTYTRGLQLYPNSGRIYSELGNTVISDKDTVKALGYYEKGIKVNPTFAANYYRAARVYCKSTTEQIWGMIYGEIFMNIERNSDRTVEISKMLYDTYKSQITFGTNGLPAVQFSKKFDKATMKDGQTPLQMTYEKTLLISSMSSSEININTLSTIRTKFLNNYLDLDRKEQYKNLLFDYQAKVQNAGHLDAYNHWILMKGDEDTFNTWQAANKTKWDAFVKWFTDNGLEITNENKFTRIIN